MPTYQYPPRARRWPRKYRSNEAAPSDLFDHLVGQVEEGRRNNQADRLSGLKVDHELELGWLLDWKIGRSRSFQDPVDIAGRAPVKISTDYVISHQTAGIDDLDRIGIHRRQFMLGRERADAGAISNEHALGRHDEPVGSFLGSSVECGRNIALALNITDLQCNTQ